MGGAAMSTQSVTALVLSETLPKKLCICGTGEGAPGSGLEFMPTGRSHQRVIPQQQDITAAISRPFAEGDLRAANHTAFITAIADFCMFITLLIIWWNPSAGCMYWNVLEPLARPINTLVARILVVIY